jgi:hypothetical protein
MLSLIAAVRAKSCQSRYHVVIWADCKTIQGLYRSFSIIADSLHLSSQGPKQLETDFENVKSWLEQLRQDWLLILDNADNMDLQGPSLMHFIPASNHGHIILTSRDPLSRGIGLGGLEVGTMTKAEATCLLLKRARLEITEENRTEAEIIVESLGCLALAVDTAGAYVLARQITLQDLSRQYGRGKKRLLHYYIPNSMRQYDYNVAKTWEISLEYLENTCKDTSNCLHLIAVSGNSVSGNDHQINVY